MSIKIIKHLYDDIENEGMAYAICDYRDYSEIERFSPVVWEAIKAYKAAALKTRETEDYTEEEVGPEALELKNLLEIS